MAMSGPTAAAATSRRRGRRRHGVISEINVTPMVDVMLVLLIIFMVAAPLLTSSIPVDLPEAKATITTKAKTEQLTVTARKATGSCSSTAEYYLGDSPIDFAELEAKIKAIKESGEKEIDPNVNLRGDKEICYSDVMRLLGRIKGAGFGANIEVIPEQEKR
jgi:biopolymer transport protein ExbD/biopolymer transport protein TolR